MRNVDLSSPTGSLTYGIGFGARSGFWGDTIGDLKTERTGRLDELDGLRGIAALMVAVGHFGRAYIETPHGRGDSSSLQIDNLLLNIVAPAHEAVLLFFVLSGFVLSLPYVDDRPQPYAVFITRRIFRIYFPYLVALGIAVAFCFPLNGPLGMTEWADHTWSRPVDWPLVLQHILFLGNYDSAQFNTAFWSLVVEMRVSLAFPLIAVWTLRLPTWVNLSFAFAVSAAATVGSFFGPSSIDGDLAFLHFATLFLVGIELARHRHKVSSRLRLLSSRQAIILFIAAYLVFANGFNFVRFAGSYVFVLHGTHRLLIGDWVSLIGVVGMLSLGMSSEAIKAMLTKLPVQFLGRTSYSLYLLHSTVLFALLHLVGKEIPWFGILPLYLGIVLPLASLMFALVERPSMNLGRALTRRTFQSLPMPTSVR